MKERDDEEVKGSDIRLCGLIHLQADIEFAAAVVISLQDLLGSSFNTYMRTLRTNRQHQLIFSLHHDHNISTSHVRPTSIEHLPQSPRSSTTILVPR